MMEIDLYSLSLYVLPVANLILLAASAMALIQIRRVLRGRTVYSKLAAGQAIVAEISALSRNTLNISTDLSEMKECLDALTSLERLLAVPASRSVPMEQATILAKNGASEDELARTCGLSIGEARLMRRLHTQDSPIQIT